MVKAKNYFDPVDTKVNFPALENKLLWDWYKKEIVKKYIDKNKSSKKYFSFLDGPITANNPMGVHHAWGRTYKDLWQRYYNMLGFRQRFQNGFDCQGLWVEVEVEKELGLKNKKDIENLVPSNKKASIAKFVELCKERVYKYADIQTEQSKRLGYFMDWDHSYYTLSDDNNYMIWHFLKKCHEKGLIYKGRDSVPWCPRCGTAISQHEILTEDYKELTHETVFFKLPILNRDFSLLVWTTTPWTIPANVALAVNPNFKYRVWKLPNGEKLVTVNPSEITDEESYKWFEDYVVETGFVHKDGIPDIEGKDLVGLKYKAPFDELPRVKAAFNENFKTFHTIVDAKDLVVATKGTGILHVAPGAGQEDFQLGEEKNLVVVDVIDEEANYYDGMDEFSGKNAKKQPELIINYLKNKEKGKYLFKTSKITHRYPSCWRCKTELVWRVVDEWYIAIDPVREDMKKVTKKIQWIPEFGLKRELDWLKNMHDWLISKKRYWGLALPIWECKKCGNFEVIGSKDELKEKAVDGWSHFDGHTPHKPWIDEVKIKCSKCGGVVERIPDVGNPWLDAGIVSFSTISEDNKSTPLYWKDKQKWGKWYPADFITESFPGQFKNWFYSLIAMSTVLENQEPFKTVLGFATLLAEDGRPMHKSWGNAIEFNEGAESIGVDVMRWMYLRHDPSQNLLFGYKVADETRRRFHLTLWNVYNFFVTYANLDGWIPKQGRSIVIRNLLDRWIIARLSDTIAVVTENLDKYHAKDATEQIESFVNDLSLWYIRRSRDRAGVNAEDKKDKDDFFNMTYLVLVNLSRILAPFTPFMADLMFTNLTKAPSVHLADWPGEKQLKNMRLFLGEENDVEKLMKEMELVRKIVEKGHSLRKEKNLAVRQPLSLATVYSDEKFDLRLVKLIEDELNVKKVVWKNKRSKDDELGVELDTKITPVLEEEAKVRELIRKIQEERKRLGVDLRQEILVENVWIPKNKKLRDLIRRVTLTSELQEGPFQVKKGPKKTKI
ncbi:isoleucine--tRNA ligase [Candidatus Woesebacteria bacterium RIFCSPLOWO2_01_FULL_39_61]|uniref:Isoleucine--tRNA ligase n=1 Tax=Candidatus Woesebacteria bacterium RIFCSPHIGHO2_02_FULL_39_13 TaxID=1802505 RepID=A0A1F7Z1Q0_9BACT|nr:MAG: isoleucine--tRNA ligase [Candidatus Woesebacteria bacterium RIFCSPHIGHO2_01_FULL_39_95]OGM33029.1 MAG: isoleucine--tRNA ligase [Candidatus Woesebacteria bacterium RIFCSPHIGHO2_02_FULL_39_13]OGM37888.1 MAG: isoleucine--tRNA ligase [Candidatus Woesebacteria bacterium RIFCSPHIGHO2_12_FULL_40_20]OGM66461.1 MAG: isoleucine--tRNA ligase [Candidatus Woesebacteria bacterium RIFCSPLOWO2_01_FULL_39_61]OGM74824.1 MAG: isoleucine--tRNA ligase [Candidatus Woesebacteria bacterium RIFCSPLOWO2_12_FULL_